MEEDIRQTMADAALKLLMEKKVRKLTVKDIVEECNITRQSFYYHFENIPALLMWQTEKNLREMLSEAHFKEDREEALKYFLLVALNAKPVVDRTMNSPYGQELERLLKELIYQIATESAEAEGLPGIEDKQLFRLILRYHFNAVVGIIREWSSDDSGNLDEIVHGIFLLFENSLRLLNTEA